MVLNEAQSGMSIWSEGYRRAEIPCTSRQRNALSNKSQQYPMPAPKGGSGKTTTAVCFAQEADASGMDVLLL
jgi:Mrp family chromosome partitioning ATPase